MRDVDYIIEAHFTSTLRWGPEDTLPKHADMITRRLKKGQTFHQPYLGCREFAAEVEEVEPVGELPECKLPPEWRSRHLGLMLHDLEFGLRIVPRFFAAKIDAAGKIEVPPFEEAMPVEGLAKEGDALILKALVELAETLGLTGDLDYQPMPVRWLLTIGSDGQLLGEMADTQLPSPSGKGKPVVGDSAASPTARSGQRSPRRNLLSTRRNMCSGGLTRRR